MLAPLKIWLLLISLLVLNQDNHQYVYHGFIELHNSKEPRCMLIANKSNPQRYSSYQCRPGATIHFTSDAQREYECSTLNYHVFCQKNWPKYTIHIYLNYCQYGNPPNSSGYCEQPFGVDISCGTGEQKINTAWVYDKQGNYLCTSSTKKFKDGL